MCLRAEAWSLGFGFSRFEPQARRIRAFTIIELLVVLALLAVALVLVAPRFGAALPGLELKSAARDVATGLRFARGRAIATGGDTRLVIDTNSGVYWIQGYDRRHALPASVAIRMVTASSEVLDDGVAAIGFFRDGSSTGGRVSLESGTRALHVDVQWLTGRVRIVDE